MTRLLRLEYLGDVTPEGEFVSTYRRLSCDGRRELELHVAAQTLDLEGVLLSHFAGRRVRVIIEQLEAPCQDQTPASSRTVSLSESPSSKTKESKRTAGG